MAGNHAKRYGYTWYYIRQDGTEEQIPRQEYERLKKQDRTCVRERKPGPGTTHLPSGYVDDDRGRTREERYVKLQPKCMYMLTVEVATTKQASI